MKKVNPPSIYISLTQSYLETARAVYTLRIEDPKQRDLANLRGKFKDPLGNILSALISISVIYSYLAVESFANYQLYKIWKHARSAHKACKKLGNKIVPKYDKFYQEFGKKKFESLKTTRLGDLAERIKEICKYLEIKKIHEVDNKLWSRFKSLLEDSRHFLIHPYPDINRFQKTWNLILAKNPSGSYAEIAADIIRYFYKQLGKDYPNWLSRNQLYKISSIKLLF